MEEFLKYLFANLNGATETAVLFIMVFIDNILGVKWRKEHNIKITSKVGLDGLKTNILMAMLPALIWLLIIVLSIMPTHIGNRIFIFDTPVFDFITFIVFVFTANYMLKSLVANAKLLGMIDNTELPSWLDAWVKDEYKVKLDKAGLNDILEEK